MKTPGAAFLGLLLIATLRTVGHSQTPVPPEPAMAVAPISMASTLATLGHEAATARGLAECAELLLREPAVFAALHCATVMRVEAEFPAEIPARILDDVRQQTARRLTVELLHHDPHDAGMTTSVSWIEWITSSRGLRSLPRPPQAILEHEPFTRGNLLLFALDGAAEGRACHTTLHVLPAQQQTAVVEAVIWRKEAARLFAPDVTATAMVLKALREQLATPNTLVRLCIVLRLHELGRLTWEDSARIVQAGESSATVAAGAFCLLRHAPEHAPSLSTLAVQSFPALATPLTDGVALGAAMHWLDHAEIQTLLGTATTYQGFREVERQMPPQLASTLSYPILSAIGDAVSPLNAPARIASTSSLARLLSVTRALDKRPKSP